VDQVDTHSTVLHYAAFPAAVTKRLADRPEIHHTPEYGGWLNAGELELAV
jgi:hypothetical protein